MDRTLQYDVSQLPDPPPEYPATVAYVRRKVASGVGEARSVAESAQSAAESAQAAAESAQSAAEAAQASAEELASGLSAKADLVGGKVPVDQLPSYVSDVYEYDSMSAFPASGDGGRIYVARDTNLTYRWGGTAYVEISPSLALGETADTAYAGSEGKALRTDFDSAYAEFGGHRDSRANPHGVTAGQVGAYTKDEVDLEFARVDADLSSCARKTDIPTGVSALANDALYVTEAQVTPSPTNAGHALSADFADGAGVAGSIFWSNVLGTPDTLAGYGITDAASGSALADLDTRYTVVAERVTSLESMDMTIIDRVASLEVTVGAANASLESVA